MRVTTIFNKLLALQGAFVRGIVKWRIVIRATLRRLACAVRAKWNEDLELLGLRERRHYDARATFTSLALGDGARKDLLRWITHAPGDVFDGYTSPPWSALCDEVAKLHAALLEGKVVPLDAGKTGGKLEDSQEAAQEAR